MLVLQGPCSRINDQPLTEEDTHGALYPIKESGTHPCSAGVRLGGRSGTGSSGDTSAARPRQTPPCLQFSRKSAGSWRRAWNRELPILDRSRVPTPRRRFLGAADAFGELAAGSDPAGAPR